MHFTSARLFRSPGPDVFVDANNQKKNILQGSPSEISLKTSENPLETTMKILQFRMKIFTRWLSLCTGEKSLDSERFATVTQIFERSYTRRSLKGIVVLFGREREEMRFSLDENPSPYTSPTQIANLVADAESEHRRLSCDRAIAVSPRRFSYSDAALSLNNR